MLPIRERSMRKAKEKAVESMQSITSSPSLSKTLNSTASSSKRNNRSYKPFAEQPQQKSDDESADDTLIVATPTKKSRSNTNLNKKSVLLKSSASRNTKNTSSRHITLVNATDNLNQDNIQQQQQQQMHDATTNSLFNQVYQGQVSMQTIVDDFIELYKSDRDTAMLDLIKFIVRCSGCKCGHLLTNRRDLLRNKEFTDIIAELIDNFNNEEDENQSEIEAAYPLVQNSLQARKFARNFADFLQLLVNQCQYSIIYDQFMLDILITFLIALADSQVRAFRHTATLAVLKVMTALVDVLLSLSVSKDAAQKQHEAERRKTSKKQAADRLEMLAQKRKELEENEYEIQNFINFIFKAVFIHRYRDVCAEIRCVCINEIGEWMRKCSYKFLDDTFLKYIGWTLYDKVAECRLKCLQALEPLYNEQDLFAKLELFTSRFKNRLVEMSLDKDYEVSVNAIRLLTDIVRQNDAALEDKDCENIYELVYHTNRHVAQAAGEFLKQKLFVKVENSTIEFKKGGSGSKTKTNENAVFLQLLVQFLIESELHDHPTYLVDAMWEQHSMLKDWSCMTELLLNDDAFAADERLNDLQEKYLIEIMTCCVRQAATGEYPIARRTTHTARKPSNKEQMRIQEDRVELTQHFITALPELITKYIADQEKLVQLLQIPVYFDLNQYTLRRQEKALDNLLNELQEIVGKHNDSDVLEECSKCLAYLCDEENSIYSRCNVIRSTIIDTLVDQFTHAIEVVDKLLEVDDNEIYPLIVALKRLSAFAQNHDVSGYDLAKKSLLVLRWIEDNKDFPIDFVSKALQLTSSILAWHLNKLYAQVEESKNTINAEDETINFEHNINKDTIEFVATLRKKFYRLCSNLLRHANLDYEEEAYFELCDLFLMFNMHLINTHRDLAHLILECQPNDIHMLTAFVMSRVFTQEALHEKPDTAENIEKLHNRRSILAAFCKLVCYNCMPIKYAAEILRGYAKYANSYGDIIKQLLGTCREISKVNTAKTIVLALQREYNEAVLNSAEHRIDRHSDEFFDIKELARKFILSFGPDAGVKAREAIVAIHHEAIAYSNLISNDSQQQEKQNQNRAPPNLPFLEVVVEFSSRLSSADKKAIMNELDKVYANRANKIEEYMWEPYYVYRRSLMDDYAHQNAHTTSRNVTTNSAYADTTNASHLTNGNVSRKRKANTESNNNNSASINMSGISRLKDSFTSDKTKGASNSINNTNTNTNMNMNNMSDIEEEEVNENDAELENIQENAKENNLSELENVKLSTIGADARLTRSAKKNSILDRVGGVSAAAVAQARNSPSKRARSPLVAANGNGNSTTTIDDSMASVNESNCVLSSTRIESSHHRLSTKSLGKKKHVTDILEINEDDTIISESQPKHKRGRKSEEECELVDENSRRLKV